MTLINGAKIIFPTYYHIKQSKKNTFFDQSFFLYRSAISNPLIFKSINPVLRRLILQAFRPGFTTLLPRIEVHDRLITDQATKTAELAT
jgi:hypothetical protein